MPKVHYSLILVFLIGIVLRFSKIQDLVTFENDNGRDMILILKLYKFHEIIYRGPEFSLIWGFLSPIYYYILAIPIITSNFNPAAAGVFTLILNSITLFLIMYFCNKIINLKAALISGILYSTSFLVILEAGKGFNTCFLPPLSVLFLFLSYEIFVKKIYSKIKWISLVLALLLSFHLSGFFFVPILIISYFIYRPKFKKMDIVKSFGIFFIVGVLPYLIQEKKNNWFSIKQFIEYLHTKPTESISIFSSINNFFLAVFKNIELNFFYSDNLYLDFLSVIIILVIVNQMVNYFKNTQKIESYTAFIICLYLFIFSVLVKFNSTNTQNQWFQPTFIPLLCIFLATTISITKVRVIQYVSYTIILVSVVLNLYSYYNYIPSFDKISYHKKVLELIQKDAYSEIYDTFPNHSRYKYLSYYYETDPILKNHHFERVNWANYKPDKNLIYYFYFIGRTNDLPIIDRNKLGFTKMESIYKDSDLIVYRFTN